MKPRALLLALAVITQQVMESRAAPDDVAVEPSEEVRNPRAVRQVQVNVERQVFPRGAAGARERFDRFLQVYLHELDEACQLSDDQESQLKLAAAGDMDRFFTSLAELRRKAESVKQQDHNVWNKLWQDIHPLRQKVTAGLFDGQSLFHKSISNVLTDEQTKQYEELAEDAQEYDRKAWSVAAVAIISQSIPMRREQQQKLQKLFERQARLQQQLPTNLHYYTLLNMLARMPRLQVKAIFEDPQWALLEPQLRQFGPAPKFRLPNLLNLFR